MIFSYCQGDMTLNADASPEEFAADLREVDPLNWAHGRVTAKIDPGFDPAIKVTFEGLALGGRGLAASCSTLHIMRRGALHRTVQRLGPVRRRFMIGTAVELQQAQSLAVHTGQRQGDLIRLRWSDHDGDAIRLAQSKTSGRGQVRRPIDQIHHAPHPAICNWLFFEKYLAGTAPLSEAATLRFDNAPATTFADQSHTVTPAHHARVKKPEQNQRIKWWTQSDSNARPSDS